MKYTAKRNNKNQFAENRTSYYRIEFRNYLLKYEREREKAKGQRQKIIINKHTANVEILLTFIHRFNHCHIFCF